MSNKQFEWIEFYESLATCLLEYRAQDKRPDLVSAVNEIAEDLGFPHLDEYGDGSRRNLDDICPFTVLSMFNRGAYDKQPKNRRQIATRLETFLDCQIEVPSTFVGVPLQFPMKSWFFDYQKSRHQDDIDSLWELFAQAIKLADSGGNHSTQDFANAFDKAVKIKHVKWNITSGLYWTRPRYFMTLDRNSRSYIKSHLRLSISKNESYKVCSANEYLRLLHVLRERFEMADCPVHSFPELSAMAFEDKTDNAKSRNLQGVTELDVNRLATKEDVDLFRRDIALFKEELFKLLEK